MSEILRIEDRNRGSMLKQGDTTVLKYYLYDIDDDDIDEIIGETADIAIMTDKGIAHTTTGVVDEMYVCRFVIDKVLPAGDYHIEFIINGKIFPSNDKPYFTLTHSSLGEDLKVIESYGKTRLIAEAKGQIEASLAPELDDLKIGKANKAQEAWTVPTLLNGWTQEPNWAVGFMKDELGFVHFKGMIKNGTSSQIFQLPAGYRPAQNSYLTGSSGTNNSGQFNILINPDGSVHVHATPARTEGVVLDSVLFKAGS